MSFAASLRAAIEVAPRADLGRLSTTIWKAWASRGLSDDEAQALSELVAARKALPAPEKPPQRRVGSRPRSPASMERRRSWVASGHLPPQLAARFTLGEAAVLAVIAVEVRKHGRCTLTIGHIAALAGVCRSTAKNALREAHALGIIRITVRRLTAWRCDSNVVTVPDGWSGAQRNCAVREAVALLRVTWRGSFKTRPPAKARRAGPSLWC
jgi:hypothetical protein